MTRTNTRECGSGVSSPSRADMFWKILSSSGVMAGLFSKVTNLCDQRQDSNRKQQTEGEGGELERIIGKVVNKDNVKEDRGNGKGK